MNERDFLTRKGGPKHMPVALTLEHVSPATRLLEKRKQMLQVQEALDAQKEDYARKEELFKRREENLRKKDLELQEALVLFNKFLKENEHKRRRADNRAAEEVKKRQKWEKEIRLRKVKLGRLLKKCRRLRRLVAQNEKYQTFLQQVHEEHSSQFEAVESIISRHFTLKEAYNDLIQKQKESAAKNESLRNEFQVFHKDQYNKTLSLNNQIANHSKLLEDAVQNTSEIELKILNEEKQESLRQRETTQIIMAVDNLFTRCKKVLKKVIKHSVENELSAKEREKVLTDPQEIKHRCTVQRLGVIARYLEDFNSIVETTSRQSTAPFRGKSPYHHTGRARRFGERSILVGD